MSAGSQDIDHSVLPPSSAFRDLRNCIVLRNPTTNAVVYVVGTAHVGDSKDDVIRVIRHAKPKAVVVELCPSRSAMLYKDEEEDLEQQIADGLSEDDGGLDLLDTAKDAADVLLDWSNMISLMYVSTCLLDAHVASLSFHLCSYAKV